MDHAQNLRATLQQRGYSLTKPRQIVYAALQGQEPLTMHELIARCGATDRASVYRTVTLFERLSIVQRLQTGWKYKLELSDRFHDHHHHATCLNCGQAIVLAEDARLEALFSQLAEAVGFQIERHQFELQGRCAACLQAAADPL